MALFFQPKNKSPEEITQHDAEELRRAAHELAPKIAVNTSADDVIGTIYQVSNTLPVTDSNGNTSNTGGTAS